MPFFSRGLFWRKIFTLNASGNIRFKWWILAVRGGSGIYFISFATSTLNRLSKWSSLVAGHNFSFSLMTSKKPIEILLTWSRPLIRSTRLKEIDSKSLFFGHFSSNQSKCFRFLSFLNHTPRVLYFNSISLPFYWYTVIWPRDTLFKWIDKNFVRTQKVAIHECSLQPTTSHQLNLMLPSSF